MNASAFMKQFTRVTAVAVIFSVLMWGPLAWVADAMTSASARAVANDAQTISNNSSPTSVLKFYASSTGEDHTSVTEVKVNVNPAGGFAPATDLNPIDSALGANAGISIYRDSATAGMLGAFDSSIDSFLPMGQMQQPGRVAKITPSANSTTNALGGITLAAGDLVFTKIAGENSGTPSFTPYNGVGPFRVYGWHMVTTGGTANASGVRFDNGNFQPDFDGFNMDTATDRFSAFTPNQTSIFNIPQAGSIVQDGTYTAPAVGDLVAYQQSVAGAYLQWGVVTNATFNGGAFAVNGRVVAAGSYRFSKLSGTTGSYVVPPGGDVTVTGAYNNASVGDLVLYQSGANDAQWGIVTNATLTGGAGQFAINGTPLAPGTYRITKLTQYSPAGATTTDNGLVLATGDLMLGMITQNPRNAHIDWNVVTTGATGVSAAALRINNASSAPVFGYQPSLVTSSSVVRFTPTSTTFQNTPAIPLSLGDIVFDPSRANALNSQPVWQIVTQAGNSGSGFSGGTARVNGQNSNGNFGAVNSQGPLSLFRPNATSTMTVPSNGDLTFDGSYTSPAVGDIVFYLKSGQNSDVIPQWGIVTDATVTGGGGVFAINGAALSSGTYTISKVNGQSSSFTVPLAGAGVTKGGTPDTYAAPSVNDVVLYQRGASPAQWGILTSSTLTGGVFAINGIPLAPGSYRISKMTSFSPTAAPVNDTNLVLTAGDVLFGLVTNYPVSNTFDWHIVWRGATGVSNAALRLTVLVSTGGGGSSSVNAAPQFGSVATIVLKSPSEVPAEGNGSQFIDLAYYAVARTSANVPAGRSFSLGMAPNAATINFLANPNESSREAVSPAYTTAAREPSILPISLTPQSLLPGATTTPVLGINLNSSATSTEQLKRIRTAVLPSNGFTMNDLAGLNPSADSGIALFRDNKTPGQGTQGVFDLGIDQGITTSVQLTTQRFAKLTVEGAASATSTVIGSNGLPSQDFAVTLGDILFARAGWTFAGAGTYYDPSYDWHMVSNTGNGNLRNANTIAVVCIDGDCGKDLAFPNASRVTRLTPATTGSYVVNGTANTVPSALAAGDLVFSLYTQPEITGSGNFNARTKLQYRPQWGIVTQNFSGTAAQINGKNLDDGAYQISKLTSVNGTYIVNGVDNITPGGAYNDPTPGDIVLYQRGTEPAAWGVVTVDTLQSGVLAINGLPLENGTWRISKLDNAGSTAYGAMSEVLTNGAYQINNGDVAFLATGSNPTAPQFGWHMVTTGAAGAQNAALRLDNATGAPSYVSIVSISPDVAESIPADDMGPNAGADFFINVKTADAAVLGHSFNLFVGPGDVVLTANQPRHVPFSTMSQLHTLGAGDTTAPTVQGGGPGNNQQGVPIDAFVDRTFSESMNPGTVTTTNVTLKTNTGNAQNGAPTGANLCTATPLDNNNTHVICNHTVLSTSTWYTLTITTGVRDTAGNPLAANFTSQFQTGSANSSVNTTAPTIISTTPAVGSPSAASFPINGKLTVQFSPGPEGNMVSATSTNPADVFAKSVLNPANIILTSSASSTNICIASCTLAWDTTNHTLNITPTGNLTAATAYQFTVKNTVRNTPGDIPLPGQDYIVQFTTSSGSDTSAPTVFSSLPALNATNVPQDTVRMDLEFSKNMDVSTLTAANTRVFLDADNSSTENGGDTVLTVERFFESRNDHTIIHFSNGFLNTNSHYCFRILGGGTGVKDVVGNALAADVIRCFTTSSQAFTASKPNVTGVEAISSMLVVRFSQPINAGDAATKTNYTIQTLSSTVLGSGTSFSSQLTVGGTITVSGQTRGITAITDNTTLTLDRPFAPPINTATAFTYTATIGGSSQNGTGTVTSQASSLNLENATVTYRSDARPPSVVFTGIGLQANQGFGVSVSGIRDASGSQTMDPVTVPGIVSTASQLFVSDADRPSFESSVNQATFQRNPTECHPRTFVSGKSTTFECQLPAPTGLRTGSQIILTFPTGFNVTNATSTPITSSQWNRDLDGPAPGTTTISSVSGVTSGSSAVVTVTIAHAGQDMGPNTGLHFELDGIVNPSSAISQQSIIFAVKDHTGTNIPLALSTGAPITIQTAGNLSISGKVCKSTTTGGTCGAATGISGANVFLDQKGTIGASGAQAGHQQTTTAGDGTYSFTQLSPGQYGIGMMVDPTQNNGLGGGGFQDLSLSANATNVDFKIVDLSTSATGRVLTINIAGGPANETVDAFCFAPGIPSMPTAITLNGAGAGSGTLRVQGSTDDTKKIHYNCGVGPHMAINTLAAGGPPPIPVFTFVPPPSQGVDVGTVNVSTSFTLQVASQQIIGKVTDGAGAGIPNVFVDARPANCFNATTGAIIDCHGGFTQTKSDTGHEGEFTLNVASGVYLIGAHAPGIPESIPETVTVKANASGADGNTTADVYRNGTLLTGAGLVMKMAKSDITISGQVQDESGNGIQYAGVDAQLIQAGGTCNAFVPLGPFRGSPTDSLGNYTLYVNAGTWKVVAHGGAYGGNIGCSIVAVTTASVSGKNIKASAADFGTMTGTVTQAGQPLSGARVFCFGPNGRSDVGTNASGVYTMTLKSGAGYQCGVTKDGSRPLTNQSDLTITSGGTTNQNFTIASAGGTIKISIAGVTQDVFCDARDSSGFGNNAPLTPEVGTTGTQTGNGVADISVPAGTYTVRCGSPMLGDLGSQTAVVTANQTIAVTLTPPTVYVITGIIRNGSANLEGADVFLKEQTNGLITRARSSAVTEGTNVSISLPAGTYIVSAAKPGYIDSSTLSKVTVSASQTTGSFGTRTLTQATGNAGTSVSVTVQFNGANYTGRGRVNITKSDGLTFSIPTDPSISAGSNASAPLTNGTWTLQAFGDNGKQSSVTSVTVANGVASATPTLTLDTDIPGFTLMDIKPQPFVPTNGGTFKDPNLGDNFGVIIPPNVLSTSDSTSGTLSVKTSSVRGFGVRSGNTVVGSSVLDISFTDSSGKEITDFSSTGKGVTITIPYTDADVTAAGLTDESKLQCAFLNDAGEWETLPTVAHPDANTLDCQTTHFTEFAPIAPTAQNAPATPTGLAATAGSTTQINLSWTATNGATSYDIYRSTSSNGTYSRLGSEPSVASGSTTTYSDTGLTAGTQYFYKISALNASGESAASTAVNATTNSVTTSSGGGSSGGGTAIVGSVSSSTSSTASSTSTTTTTTPAATQPATPTTTTTPAATPAATTKAEEKPKASVVTKAPDPATLGPVTRALALGSKGSDVKTLQEVLKAEGFYTGAITGEVDAATLEAVRKLQVDRKLAKPGERGYGNIGPATRALVNIVLKELQQEAKATKASPAPTAPTKATTPAAAPSISNEERMKQESERREKEYQQVVTFKESVMAKYTSSEGALQAPSGAKPVSQAATIAEQLVSKITSVLAPAAVKAVLRDVLTNLPEPAKKVGAGQLAAALNSTRKANNNTTPEDPATLGVFIQNAILVSVGRFHLDQFDNPKAEKRAAELLSKLYGRTLDPAKRAADGVAIEIATYGLQPTRDTKKEAFCVPVIKKTYGKELTEGSAEYWDVVRACAYSGATR